MFPSPDEYDLPNDGLLWRCHLRPWTGAQINIVYHKMLILSEKWKSHFALFSEVKRPWMDFLRRHRI